MSQREKSSLSQKVVIRVGAEVEAPWVPEPDSDAEAEGGRVGPVYWPAIIEQVVENASGKRVEVRFTNTGERDIEKEWFEADELQYRGYQNAQKHLRPSNEKRLRKRPADMYAEHIEERTRQPPAERTRQQHREHQEREAQSDSDDEEVVSYIIKHKGEGDNAEYLGVRPDGSTKWYPRASFLQKDGITTAALLLYERVPALIMQRDGDDLLIKWERRSSADWAYIHRDAIMPQVLARLEHDSAAYFGQVPEHEIDSAKDQFYMAVQRAIASHTREHTVECFPLRWSRALLGGKGTQIDRPSRGGARQPYFRLDRDDVAPMFDEIDPHWDIVRDNCGVNKGTIDFSGHDRGIIVRYYARESTLRAYWRTDTGELRRKPKLFVQSLDVIVTLRRTDPEDDLARAERLRAAGQAL